MAPRPTRQSLLLPDRARLFHIGLPKTGTTALQNTAAAHRAELLEAGVRYPGRTFNHRREVSSFMGRGWGWGNKPTLDNWNRLMAEIEADTEHRIWLGHEFASESSEETVTRFADALGERLHVVITLRHYGSILASSWQQYMKMGDTIDFESWLEAVLADPPNRSVTHTFHVRNDQGLVVTRWAGIVGAENVTVIVTDKRDRAILSDTFADLLGVPRTLLATPADDGFRSNRGMSVEEAELLRHVNVTLRDQRLPWAGYEALVRDGAAQNMLRTRRPGELERAPLLPPWAARRAEERAARYTDQIEASGVRVVGDLDVLRAPVSGREDAVGPVEQVPLDAAVSAVLGAVEAGVKHAEKQRKASTVSSTMDGIPAAELARELARRVRRRAGHMMKGRRD